MRWVPNPSRAWRKGENQIPMWIRLFCARAGNHLDKEPMNPTVHRKLGMKGGRQHPALPHQCRITFAKGQNLDACSGLNDAGSANENHLQRPTRQRGLRSQNS
jgi:hypothetical protein